MKLLDGSGGTSGAFSFLVGTSASCTAATDTVTQSFADLSTLITAGGTGMTDNANADSEILLLDTSIAAVKSERAKAGSFSNRLDSTVSSLTNNSNNLTAGKGRIENAHFAAETTSLVKSQILQQASTAMRTQANASKHNVLSLLQG